MKLPRIRNRFSLLLLLLALASGGFVIFRSAPPIIPIQPSAQFLPVDSKIPAQPASWFERSIPITWAWLWRLRDRLRVPTTTILIDVNVIDCAALSEGAMAGLLPETAAAETNGLRAWILEDQTLKRLKQQLDQTGGRELTSPRVQTAHAIQASMSMTQTIQVSGGSAQVGLFLDLLPLIRPDGTELTSRLTLTEAITNRFEGGAAEVPGTGAVSIVTNLATAARYTLPDGTGVFMLGAAGSNDSRRIAVILSARAQRPSKK